MTKKIYRILRREERRLPVTLTEQEVMGAADRLGAIDAEQEQIESEIEEKKNLVKGLTTSLEALSQESRRMARMVRTKTEERPVEVTHEANIKSGLVQEVRQDTHEVIRERKMTKDENQGVLFQEEIDRAVEGDEVGDSPVPPKRLPTRDRADEGPEEDGD